MALDEAQLSFNDKEVPVGAIIVKDNEETNYIMATLALYMNIYNLFVNLLHLLLAFMGNRD